MELLQSFTTIVSNFETTLMTKLEYNTGNLQNQITLLARHTNSATETMAPLKHNVAIINATQTQGYETASQTPPCKPSPDPKRK
eukprot:15352131-Ditylum_brightwellii.AAC.1